MDSLRLFKKRMVYPETLKLDQVSRKSSPNSGSSWSEDETSKTQETSFVRGREINSGGCKNELERNASSANSGRSSSSLNANRQFIQDRIRHLIEAFSNRTQETRQRLETPATPSSVSSHETLDPTPTAAKILERTLMDARLPDYEATNPPTSPRSYLLYIKKTYDKGVVDPQGKVYVIWMFIASMAVLYNVWLIPLRSSFPYQDASNRAYWMFFDYFCDFIYVLDIFLMQPRIIYLSEGFWMKDINFTKQNYRRNLSFKLDLLSLLPLDILYLVWGPEKIILRLPRFFKIHTFFTFFSHVDKRIASPHILRLGKTCLYMIYMIHLNACAYYAFSAWEGIGSNTFVFDGKGNAYVRCFYFATKTATSIGKNKKPTKTLEYMFMTFSWLMGVFIFAILIGQIRDIIATATRSQTEYRKLVDETLEYMRRLNLPQDMQKRVQLWFNYTWDTQHTLDENSIMDCLPHKMKTDIAINVHIRLLSKVNLFADCDEALLRELVLKLKSVIYLPGDIICKKGDVGKEMYIVQSGRVQVMGRSEDDVLATLTEGSVFGEISLLGIAGMNRRTADVKSKGYSNLFVLNKADLNAALTHYPEAQELLNKKAKLLMKKNAQLERKHKALIVINNPTPAQPQARLIDTVLQVVPPDSKANRLLRYGSRGKPRDKKNNDKFKQRASLPSVRDIDSMASLNEATLNAVTEATVHRSMS